MKKLILLLVFIPTFIYSQWYKQPVPSDIQALVSIDFSGTKNGAACGFIVRGDFLGRIVYTSDGGKSWNNAVYPSSCSWLRHIQFIDSLNGYIVGDYNITDDKNISSISESDRKANPAHLYDINILESVDRGIPYRALLLKTTDGGRTWSVPENFTSGAYAYTGLNFKNLKSGYVTTQFFYNKGFIGGIMKTDDGGQSWDTLYIKDNISCYGINILENGTIFVESYNHTENKSIILKSINEGQTWEETIFVNERLTSGDFIDNNTGIYVGYNHNYKTTDGGDNWTELKDSILNNKSFVDFKLLKGTETGILLGINTQNFIPVILKTTNIGISWNETVISPTPTDLDMAFSVGFQSTDNWFASGGYEGAVIYNTDNGGTVSISENNITVPKDFSLNQNYPNPFNPTTMISFTIPQESFVSIKIYNSLGQEVTKLVNETKQAGNYDYNFDASSLSSGMYFYKIEAGDFKKVKSMVLLR